MAEGGYANWRALELATKEAAKRRERDTGSTAPSVRLDAQIQQARFDRFLTRVFADGEQSGWMLKGGLSMLARVPAARRTKDVDLAADLADLDEAREALSRAVDVDLGDHMTFRFTGEEEIGQGENQPGVLMRRFVFACIDTSTGEGVERGTRVKVDVVVGPAPVGKPEVVEPASRLHLARPLVTHPYRLYPTVDQIADKVCATMSTYGDSDRRSSRVKDLVDLVVLARTQKVNLEELRVAIATKAALSQLTPFTQLQVPNDWAQSYPKEARGVPGAGDLTPAEAEAYVAQLVDPALAPVGSETAVWVPGAGWTAPEAVEATEVAVAADVAAGGDVYVRHHIRGGWPVREHWRAARGTAVGQSTWPRTTQTSDKGAD
ncbi:nucleotidyl transferase AbiEii/AbiGii toxin family protein [Nocardioides limicola]|uniref:nucleotidyl transferase AbiEii/AbiGii toxin family protein n=1 Tax=Nocardioides limicola TaxID=2803368 RepID=UPI0027DE6D9F|nr:nucleotidyl transferase AbiEii/AbiGii toxin family protein [Nocardioides sp. DJM-14]